MGLLVVLVAELVGCVLAVVALVMSARARREPTALRRRTNALALSIVAILLSYFSWRCVLTGKDTRGDPVDAFGDDFALTVPVLIEALATGVAAVSLARAWMRRDRT